MNKKTCPSCNGTRIKKEAHYFRIGGKNIGELASSPSFLIIAAVGAVVAVRVLL